MTPRSLARGAEQRTSLLVGTRNGIEIWAGVSDLVILKSAKSGFEGFARDPYTTLKETSDHVFAATAIRKLALFGRRNCLQRNLARRAAVVVGEFCRARKPLAAANNLRDGRRSLEKLRITRGNPAFNGVAANTIRLICRLLACRTPTRFSLLPANQRASLKQPCAEISERAFRSRRLR